MDIPNGWPLALSLMPASRNSSQVSGNVLTPASSNQSFRYIISWPMFPCGTDFHLPLSTDRSLISSYQPPCSFPTASAMSDTSTRASR